MIATLRRLFADTGESDEDREHSRHLVAAALLVEVARADDAFDGREEEMMASLLAQNLQIAEDEARALVADAQARVDHATSLYEFTRQVNDHYSPAERCELVADMWRVAYADGNLDKYEEHLIRRIAELLYVPHAQFIRGKLTARPQRA